jgi:hypothetical protein
MPSESVRLIVRCTPGTPTVRFTASAGCVKVKMTTPLPSLMTEMLLPGMPSSSTV